ncbi:SdpI family protein [Thermaerobacter sp. FW80]|uniref:SdpI family protein n=1 Tax=Thermaerobacter sp. FW80 TaxID=2546351 RepID=UPI00107533C7|nr:SdpI family protein [Thermaerobacter sp. FW80]QBS38348.1 SdpI family protein [Thermaerobacter sp. FW80]
MADGPGGPAVTSHGSGSGPEAGGPAMSSRGGHAAPPQDGQGPDRDDRGRDVLEWLLLALAALATAGVYPRLPDQMVIHWNAAGQPDGWAPRAFAAWFGWATAAGTYLLLKVLPSIDPRRANYPRFAGAYRLVRQITVLFLLGVHAVVLMTGLGIPVAVDRVIGLGVGLMLIIMGNVMGQVRPNFFFGIRTPWTLSSEAVWRKTHRAGGWLFILAGLAIATTAFLPPSWTVPVILASVIGVTMGTTVYSYLLWRRLNGADMG